MKLLQLSKTAMAALMLLAAFFAPSEGKTQGLDAMLDINRFRISDSTAMLEIAMLVAGNSVSFTPVAKGKYQARVSVIIEIADSVGIRAADKLVMLSPVITDTTSGRPNFQMAKRFLLPDGNYTLQITSADANRKGPESKVDVPLEIGFGAKNKVQISDIMLLSSYRKTDKKENGSSFVRNGYELIPAMTNFYPPAVNELSFYTELYNLQQVLGPDEPLLVIYGIYPERRREPFIEFSKHYKQTAQPVNIVMAGMDITKLPSGNFNFGIEVRDKNNKVLAVNFKPIQRSSQEAANMIEAELKTPSASGLTFGNEIDSTKLELYLLSLQPIANTNENSFIQGLAKSGKVTDQRKYMEHFWKRRSSDNAEGLWLDYKNRIDYVEKTFGLKNYRGYQTDRGRVYLQYGPPNRIDNERTDVQRKHISTDIIPYQIWLYYHAGTQNNKTFVFVQSNLGNDNFKLTHSDMPGEVNFPDWRKEVVQQKFSGSQFSR